jgi:hypothetical protein
MVAIPGWKPVRSVAVRPLAGTPDRQHHLRSPLTAPERTRSSSFPPIEMSIELPGWTTTGQVSLVRLN